MTNTDVVLATIRKRPGATDGELRVLTGVEPHQQVNQICRRLAQHGVTERRPRQDGLLGNFPLGYAPGSSVEHPRHVERDQPGGSRTQAGHNGTRAERALSSSQGVSVLPPPRSALILMPCSGEKDVGGRPASEGTPSITDSLSPGLASQLLDARLPVLRLAGHDPRALLPAVDRYQGHLYRAASPGLTKAIEDGFDLASISGGFGLLHPLEAIGHYNREFRRSDWPRGILESALVDLARHLGHDHVVAFCSRTTGYADLIRRTPWKASGLTASLLTPNLAGRGGALRLAPKASGEALTAYLRDDLHDGWYSSDGVGVDVDVR